jgi:SAM-dependent methyltransferase
MPDVQSMFGPNAAKYASSKVHANPDELERLVKLVDPAPTDRVLDVATGTGNVALEFAPHVAEVVALDLTPPMLDQVRLGAEARGLTNVQALLGDACDMPETLVDFDVVVVRLAPHHFPSIDAFLAGANRVLKPGGKLLVADTATPNDPALNLAIDEIETLRDPSHVHNLTHGEWRAAFAGNGFEVTFVEEASDWSGELDDRMDFDTWVERINTPQENRAELRRRMLEASPAVVEAMRIEVIGNQIAFALPRITILGFRT